MEMNVSCSDDKYLAAFEIVNAGRRWEPPRRDLAMEASMVVGTKCQWNCFYGWMPVHADLMAKTGFLSF